MLTLWKGYQLSYYFKNLDMEKINTFLYELPTKGDTVTTYLRSLEYLLFLYLDDFLRFLFLLGFFYLVIAIFDIKGGKSEGRERIIYSVLLMGSSIFLLKLLGYPIWDVPVNI